MSATCAMSAAHVAETPGYRETPLSSHDRVALSPALTKVFVLVPNSSESQLRYVKPPSDSLVSASGLVCFPAFVPPREGPSDRGHSTTKTFTHGEILT
jgi:hypothetical protein